MGLTFQQQFYTLPDEVYLVFNAESVLKPRPIGIIEVPEDFKKRRELELLCISKGYIPVICCFDELVTNGYEILNYMDVNNRDFGIY